MESLQDNSGTIERDEFLSLPQVSSNPLATRYATVSPIVPESAAFLHPQVKPKLTLAASV